MTSLKSVGMSGLAVVIATWTFGSVAHSADLSIKRDAHKSLAATERGGVGLIGSTNTPSSKPEIGSPAVSHVLAARNWFVSARSAMERGIRAREAAAKDTVAAVSAAMTGVRAELAIAARHTRSPELVTAALTMSEDWCRSGFMIIDPPAEGVLELPTPMTTVQKADRALAAFDQLLEKSAAVTTLGQSASPSRQRQLAANNGKVPKSSPSSGR